MTLGEGDRLPVEMAMEETQRLVYFGCAPRAPCDVTNAGLRKISYRITVRTYTESSVRPVESGERIASKSMKQH